MVLLSRMVMMSCSIVVVLVGLMLWFMLAFLTIYVLLLLRRLLLLLLNMFAALTAAYTDYFIVHTASYLTSRCSSLPSTSIIFLGVSRDRHHCYSQQQV